MLASTRRQTQLLCPSLFKIFKKCKLQSLRYSHSTMQCGVRGAHSGALVLLAFHWGLPYISCYCVPCKQRMTSQVLCALPFEGMAAWVQDPGLGLANSGCCGHLGNEPTERFSFFLSLTAESLVSYCEDIFSSFIRSAAYIHSPIC